MTFYKVAYRAKTSLPNLPPKQKCFTSEPKANNFIKKLRDCDTKLFRYEIDENVVRELYHKIEKRDWQVEELQNAFV